MKKIDVSILGASGYSGIEVYRILRHHPSVTVRHLFAQSTAGKRVDELYPDLRTASPRVFETYDAGRLKDSDVVFVALPAGESMRVIPELLANNMRVIDLGGDFRLQDTAQYETYYKRPHTAPDTLKGAFYSMPELHTRPMSDMRLVSNPGCYPTSAILPLAPLLKDGLIHPEGITINSLSGVSGAGRSSSVDLSFAEVGGSVKAYRVGIHQHTPEIEIVLSSHSGSPVRVTFTPHLLPITRGILTTITAATTAAASEEAIAASFSAAYDSAPFVRLLGQKPAEIKSVVYTNFIDIGWHMYPRNGHVIVMSSIDNLVKGAAGQAVQNFNRMFGFDDTVGL